jgi:hypothetical protein
LEIDIIISKPPFFTSITLRYGDNWASVGYFFGYLIGFAVLLYVLNYYATRLLLCYRIIMLCLLLLRQWLYENGRFVSLLFTLVLLTLLGSSVYGTRARVGLCESCLAPNERQSSKHPFMIFNQ